MYMYIHSFTYKLANLVCWLLAKEFILYFPYGICSALSRNCIFILSIVLSILLPDRGNILVCLFHHTEQLAKIHWPCTAKLRRQIWFYAFNSQNYIKATLLLNLEIYILYTNPPLISSLSFLWAFIAVLSSSVTSEQKVH